MSFIDNQENDTNIIFYWTFNNAETDTDETLKNEYEQGFNDIKSFDEISNLCESSEEELEIDDFKNLEDKIKKFTENLLPKSNENEDDQHNSFIRAILYAIRYQKEIKQLFVIKMILKI